MALVRNLSLTDRALRVLIGALLGVVGVLARTHILGAIVLGLTGVVILVEGAIGH